MRNVAGPEPSDSPELAEYKRIEPRDGTPADVILLVLAEALKHECINLNGHSLNEPHGNLANHWCFQCRYCSAGGDEALHIHVAKDTLRVT